MFHNFITAEPRHTSGTGKPGIPGKGQITGKMALK
jgi:hypothetical protein